MLEWLKKKQPMLKRLFVISVMVIVTFELLSIGKNTLYLSIKTYFSRYCGLENCLNGGRRICLCHTNVRL